MSLGSAQSASAVSAETEIGLVWADAEREVWFARLSTSGEVLADPLGLGPLADYLVPGLCWDGSAYAIAYTERGTPEVIGDVYFARIADDEIGEPLLLSQGDGASWAPRIACGDAGYGVAWQHDVGGTVPGTDLDVSRIEFATVSADGATATPPIAVEPAGASQSMLPRVAALDGEGYLVSWGEYDSTTYRQELSGIDGCDAPPDAAEGR